MGMIILLVQAAQESAEADGFLDKVWDFLDSPAPYSPFSEYLLVLFVLWLLARRAQRKESFDTQAQDVLDQKYAQGEISKKSYDKFRQDVSLRPKR